MALSECDSSWSAVPAPTERIRLVNAVEALIVSLVEDLVAPSAAPMHAIHGEHARREEPGGVLGLQYVRGAQATQRRLNNQLRSRRPHLAHVLYVLGEVHQLLMVGGSCSARELFYKDRLLIRHQGSVQRAIRTVCKLLEASPCRLGILASGKGLVAGALRMFLSSGAVIDCNANNGALLLPPDFNSCVEHLETTASFGLIVEKDTIFSKLLSNDVFGKIGTNAILITGKGYPDLSTRILVQRLWRECRLPMYILVDADPFGVDIMLVYRHGSMSMASLTEQLACPQIRWIGVHPSEIDMMHIPSVPLTERDRSKVAGLLQRDNLDAGIQHELHVLQALQRKAEIEGMSSNYLHFFLNDYIPNKIKRNLLI